MPEGHEQESNRLAVTIDAALPDLVKCKPISLKGREKSQLQGESFMPTIATKDGTQIYYKDWGKGQPIVFSHGWPLSADDWDNQMMFFLNHGYRVIAHDRRGHGRSSQTGDGHDMDHYADDLAALTAHLDLKDAIHVGHSTGGGEVVHRRRTVVGKVAAEQHVQKLQGLSARYADDRGRNHQCRPAGISQEK
jgi:hypothetical protein